MEKLEQKDFRGIAQSVLFFAAAYSEDADTDEAIVMGVMRTVRSNKKIRDAILHSMDIEEIKLTLQEMVYQDAVRQQEVQKYEGGLNF